MWYRHIMRYYPALKRKEILIPHNMDEPSGHYAKWNNPDAKDKHRLLPLTGEYRIAIRKTERLVFTGLGVGGWGVTVQWVQGFCQARQHFTAHLKFDKGVDLMLHIFFNPEIRITKKMQFCTYFHSHNY